jgi:glucokinase
VGPSKNPSYFLGFDVGGSFTKAVLIHVSGRPLQKETLSSTGFERKSYFAKSLKEVAGNLLLKEGVSASRLKGVGLGLPGPVDFDRGLVLSLTNIKGWKNFHIVSFLKSVFKVPVVVDNDANCMALAESRFGAAAGSKFALCVTLGTGVGGGLILNGSIHRGPFFLGGEIGHIPADVSGSACACGGKGCLELYVGNRAIAERVRRVFRRDISLEQASRLAAAGDPRARKIWRQTGWTIGCALAGIANVFGPQVIVVGGGVAQAGPVLLGSIRASLNCFLMRPLKNRILVKPARLGQEAGMLGAAILAKEFCVSRGK